MTPSPAPLKPHEPLRSWKITGILATLVGIGLVLATAMVVNLLVAAFSGITIPLVMDRLGIDPALAGAVILTTVTDVVGFMSFLGLATWFLL